MGLYYTEKALTLIPFEPPVMTRINVSQEQAVAQVTPVS